MRPDGLEVRRSSRRRAGLPKPGRATCRSAEGDVGIEQCRAQRWRHVLRCRAASSRSAYNSCRNRHCPKCQGSAALRWLEDRQADLLPVPYFHLVFTLPAQVACIAYTNKEVVYALLFEIAARTCAPSPPIPSTGSADRGDAGAAHLGFGR